MTDQAQAATSGPLVTFTETARQKLLEVLDEKQLRGQAAVRLAVQGRGPNGLEYAMALEPDGQPDPGDAVIDLGDFRVFVDAESAPQIQGATVDYVEDLMGGGFQIHNPNPLWSDPLAQGIQELIDTRINPSVRTHGGWVTLIDVKDNIVYVRLGGGCQGCGMVDVTLRQGIEALIKRQFPQIEAVVDTTDHRGGTNPYYQPAKGAAGQSPFYSPSKG